VLVEEGRLGARLLGRIARLLGVTTRTLSSWKALARRQQRGERLPMVGRPAHSAAAREAALERVARVRRCEVGGCGWRTLRAHEELEGVPTRLVQASLRELKATERREEAERIARERVHVEVLARDALWSQDGTHLGREQGVAAEAQPVRDAASTATLSLHVGRAPSGKEVAAILERTAAERGGWPLVWSSDNASVNGSPEVEALLERERVVHLRNVPHVPEHNPWVERGHRELKGESGLGRGSVLAGVPQRMTDVRELAQGPLRGGADASQGHVCTPEAGVAEQAGPLQGWAVRLQAAWQRLDGAHVRTSRGGHTALELDRLLPRADDLVDRESFWRDTRSDIERALQGLEGTREQRRVERSTIFAALERAGVVRRTRGGRPLAGPNEEGVS
jgi:hypothetical protein